MSTDISISFDTTGSMSAAIGQVRRNVTALIDDLFLRIPDLRMSITAHGDYCDRSRVISTIPFTSDETSLRDFIKGNRDTDGGDSDECYEYVLSEQLRLSWRKDANKILIMIGDANPHYPGYSYSGKTYQYDWREEAERLSTIGVKIFAVQALSRSSSSKFWHQLADLGNGKHVNLPQFGDVVEAILAVCYHQTGQLEEYEQELQNKFKMNRNIAAIIGDLRGEKVDLSAYSYADVSISTRDYVPPAHRTIASSRGRMESGLIPVPPGRFQITTLDAGDKYIKDWVNAIGARFQIGRGFYQFTKKEEIQERKEVVLVRKMTGEMFTGTEARNFIGLPYGTRGTVSPGDFDEYEVFVQSTSPNRKLIGGTKFLYEVDEWA